MAASFVFYIAIGMCAVLTSLTQVESRIGRDCCPKLWASSGEACYRMIAKPETWADAEAKCQQLGNGLIPGWEGHLISIHNQDESDFVRSYYESSVLIIGRQKKSSKPKSSNALWLGLNKQDSDLDTFVWSDKTEISTDFWQDALYDTNHNCGHMWTSPSKYKGKWNDASCTTKLPYMCKLVRPQNDRPDGPVPGYLDDGSSSSAGLLPCSYRGNIILHRNTLVIDECTTCDCYNSTVHCNIKSCQPTFCDEPLKFEGECCHICPYVVPVHDVQLSGVDSVKAGTVNNISVELQVSIAEDGQQVRGRDLWKVGMWASRWADGSGKKIGFEEQVLTDEQASSSIDRPQVFGGFEFSIPDINFSLDASGASCKHLQYLCASFNKGDAPETHLYQSQPIPVDVIGFDVYGVVSNPARLIVCQQFTNCNNNDKGRKSLI